MAEQAASTVTITATSAPTTVVSSSSKSLKRKLEDAIQSLDEAVIPTPPPTQPAERPVPKRLRTSRSIYGMLTKYSKSSSTQTTPHNDIQNLSKTAPQLARILTRAATRTAKALPIRLAHGRRPFDDEPVDYRPSSAPQFFARLATFKLSTYSNKPAPIDAVAAAKAGWVNTDKDRLLCKVCGASWVLAVRDGMPREAANALVEKQHGQLVAAHKDGCPWKTRQCDDSINSIPLKTPVATVRELKSRAVVLDRVLQGVKIGHPLSNLQVQNLISVISSVALSTTSDGSDSEASMLGGESPSKPPLQKEPSEVAVLAALFGWDIAPQAPDRPRASPSISRAGSVVSRAGSRPPVSRASSVSRAGTPSPASASAAPFRPSIPTALLSQHSLSSTSTSPASTILHCPLCHRRIGLWAYLPKPESEDDPMTGDAPVPTPPKKPQPSLNVLQEHRPYCAYVVRTSVMPAAPAPAAAPAQQNGHQRSASLPAVSVGGATSGMVEGWRAVLSVVMRHGAVQRQRLGLSRVQSAQVPGTAVPAGDAEVEMEGNSIEAMVDGVKKRGGKDLLKYVRGLLA